MTDALLADLRSLADQADEAVALDAIHDWERGWRQAHRKNARDLRDLIAKHAPEPDEE